MGALVKAFARMADTGSLGAPYRIALCALALATIMMATCNFTKDIPSLPENDVSTDMQVLMQVQADMEAVDVVWEPNQARHNSEYLLQKKGGSSVKKLVGTKVAKGKKAKNVAKQGSKRVSKGKKNIKQTAVQKALQIAANAKIEAMAQQRKALQAAARAKEAANKAAKAPVTAQGREIVKRAQKTAHDSAMAVEAAKAAVHSLMKAKAKASKAILDAAGGKYLKETGYQGQGGYFGAALRTAFNNGKLTERLKYRDWKKSSVTQSAKIAFKRGEKEGFRKGFLRGEKRGEIKELPKAVKKAEKLLAKKKKAKEIRIKARKKSDQSARLKKAAAKEASVVRKQVESKQHKSSRVEEFIENENVEGSDNEEVAGIDD